MLEAELVGLGFSDKESAVYTAVLEAGKVTPARISAMTGVRRPTVYAIANDLVQRGYLAADESKKILYYSPTPPSELGKIAKRMRFEVSKQEELIDVLATSLRQLPQSKSYVVPKLKFIEGADRVEEYLYERTPVWFKNAHDYDGTCMGFQDHTFVEHEQYRKWVEWCTLRTDFVDTRLLSNDTNIEVQMRENKLRARSIKFWGEVTDFSASQWIMGDYSMMLVTREKPHYLVEMKDAVYTANMRKLFKNLWEEIK